MTTTSLSLWQLLIRKLLLTCVALLQQLLECWLGGEDFSVLVSVDRPLVTLTSGMESEFCGCGGVLSCCWLF
jgi:hypothetical protein